MPTGIYDHSKRKGFKHSKKTIQKIKLARAKQIKEKSPTNWKGGRILRSGYIYVKCYNSHYNGKYVAEHRLIMEKHIGRYLTKQEVVHHKNDIKTDNRIKNLELFSSRGQHTKIAHPEIAKKNSISNKNIRKSTKTEFKKGQIPWNKGIPMAKKSKEKLKKTLLHKIKPHKHL